MEDGPTGNEELSPRHHEKQNPFAAPFSTWYSPTVSERSNSMSESIPDSMVTVFAKSRDVSMSPMGLSSNRNPPGFVAPPSTLRGLGAARSWKCWACCCCVRVF